MKMYMVSYAKSVILGQAVTPKPFDLEREVKLGVFMGA